MKISRKALDSMTILGLGIALFGIGFGIRASTKIAYVLYGLAAIYTVLAILNLYQKKSKID